MSNTRSLDFSYAFGQPVARGKFRSYNQDFIVREDLGFVPSGEGEHLLVHIKKNGENTSWVAEKLAAYFKVKIMDVSYCGKKDRNAITSQWFSVYLPGNCVQTDWQDFISRSDINADVIDSARHTRKLRRGSHKANRFRITLRDVDGIEDSLLRLDKVKSCGVPNYFGEQRFGRQGSNLCLAARWFDRNEKIKNRGKRSMVLSAARSYLFNQVVSARVKDANWRRCLDGDPSCTDEDESSGHPSGPLWGRGRSKSSGQTLAIEQATLADFALWCEQLEHQGLSQERRSLILRPTDLTWQVVSKDLVLEFGLLPGQYATSLLREVLILE